MTGTRDCPRCSSKEPRQARYCTHCGVALRGAASALAAVPAILVGGYIALFGQIFARLVERAAMAEVMLPEAFGWLISVPLTIFSFTGLLFALLGGAVTSNRLGDSELLQRVASALGVGMLGCGGAGLSLWLGGIGSEIWYLAASALLPLVGATLGVRVFRFLGQWAPFSWFERSLSGDSRQIPYAVLFPLVTLTMLLLPLLVGLIFLFSLVFSAGPISRELEGQEAS